MFFRKIFLYCFCFPYVDPICSLSLFLYILYFLLFYSGISNGLILEYKEPIDFYVLISKGSFFISFNRLPVIFLALSDRQSLAVNNNNDCAFFISKYTFLVLLASLIVLTSTSGMILNHSGNRIHSCLIVD